MPLRKYQQDALDNVVRAYDSGVTRQLIAMATGTGKSYCVASLPTAMGSRIPGQMWVIAHREERITQAVAKIRRWNPLLAVDYEMGEHYANPHADVIVGSIASIGKKGTKRTARFDWSAVTKVVVDECHHSTAISYQSFLETAGFMQRTGVDSKKSLSPVDSQKLLLGVTATPSRGDGAGLGGLFQTIVYSYTIRNAIGDGWLADLRAYRVRSETNLDDVRMKVGDFQTDDLSRAVNNDPRNELIVKGWLDHGEGKQTVGFCVDVQHAIDLAATYRSCGVRADAVWGQDPNRASKLRAHKTGEITVLLNCGVLVEGYDDWQIGCIVLARPTKSSTLFTQMVGTGTRLQEGAGNLLEAVAVSVGLKKTECIVIDVCDTTRNHKLQTVPTLLGLEYDVDLKGQLAVKSIEALEHAQAENPHIDFSKLDDITKLKTLVERVNLWGEGTSPLVDTGSTTRKTSIDIVSVREQRANSPDVVANHKLLDDEGFSDTKVRIIHSFRFRDGKLTIEQVRQLLNLETRIQMDDFLRGYQIYDRTGKDIFKDLATLDRLRQTKTGG